MHNEKWFVYFKLCFTNMSTTLKYECSDRNGVEDRVVGVEQRKWRWRLMRQEF